MGKSGASALTLSCWMLAEKVVTLASEAGELGALRGDLREDLLLIELGEDLAFGDHLIDVDVEFFDEAGGLWI